jgi:dihydroneopterin aldolase
MTTIHLTGIHAFGRHGANPGEREESQEFVVDLDVDVEPGADELAATADYRAVADTARRVVEDGSFVLLETLAREVAAAVRGFERVTRVRAVVHKPGAARKLGVDEVCVSAELR